MNFWSEKKSITYNSIEEGNDFFKQLFRSKKNSVKKVSVKYENVSIIFGQRRVRSQKFRLGMTTPYLHL